MLAATATVTDEMRRDVIDKLDMSGCEIVSVSPNKSWSSIGHFCFISSIHLHQEKVSRSSIGTSRKRETGRTDFRHRTTTMCYLISA